MYRRIVVLSVALLLAGCAGSGQQVIQPEYQQKISSRPTVGLLPLGADLLPPEILPQIPPMTRRGRDLYYRLFGLTLSDLAQVAVLESGKDFRPEVAFVPGTLPLDEEDQLEVPLPDGGPVFIDGRAPAFLLLLDDLTFQFGTEEGREALGTLSTERLVVSARCEYVLWDNREGRLVGYGRLFETAPMEAGAAVRAPLTLLLRRIAISIIRKSPFLFVDDVYAGT